MSRGAPIVLLLLVGLTAGCTIPNPRLCQNQPGGCAPDGMADSRPDATADSRGNPTPPADLAVVDLARADLTSPRDLAIVDLVNPCADGACGQCQNDDQCATGKYCDAPTCQPCDNVGHCGPMCSMCTGSALPQCGSATAGCGCVLDSDCGSSGDICSNGACSRTCTTAKNCTTAPDGTACVGTIFLNAHCGCNSSADCPSGATCNVNNVCVCGSTVCKYNQTCKDGTCT